MSTKRSSTVSEMLPAMMIPFLTSFELTSCEISASFAVEDANHSHVAMELL